MAEETSPLKKLSLIHMFKIGLRLAHRAGTAGRGWWAENKKAILGKEKSQNFLIQINII